MKHGWVHRTENRFALGLFLALALGGRAAGATTPAAGTRPAHAPGSADLPVGPDARPACRQAGQHVPTGFMVAMRDSRIVEASHAPGRADLPVGAARTRSSARWNIRGYAVAGQPLLSTSVTAPALARFTGPDKSLDDIVEAAAALQSVYRQHGLPAVTVAFAPEQIADGVVTLNVAQTAAPLILVAGVPYRVSTNGVELAANALPEWSPATAAATNGVASPPTNAPPVIRPIPPASAPQMAEALAALHRKIAELNAGQTNTRIYAVSTNAGPRFTVEHYVIEGNTLLSPATIGDVITNIVGAFGTNVSFDGIKTVVTQLGQAYSERGYGMTVSVIVPQQQLTHATVKLQVIESRLAEIDVVGNRFFSSNNVMRALPSLHTNLVLNGPIFDAELNRANANQDRQIYPVIAPGPAPGTSKLTLQLVDRLPLHAKLELNNQSSPGTPDLRLNGSAEYDNLWQREQSLGVQYGFSPEVYKQGSRWDFYDRPQVAYYSGFYRLPLGSLEPIEKIIANNPLSFGYNEATRQFRLPPPSGRPELNLYASRATIDTGLETLSSSSILNIPGVVQITQQDLQQDVTINQDVGFQLTQPLPELRNLLSSVSGGLDFKTYSQDSDKNNLFTDAEYTYDENGRPLPPIISEIPGLITTHSTLDYLPLELQYQGSLRNSLGLAGLGLGVSANLWYSSSSASLSGAAANSGTTLGGLKSLQFITGSTRSTGHWVILRPSFSQQFSFYTNWPTTFRADGQWASEPVVSTEQFGVGGVNSVRGYHEGEVFGDTGWHVSLEQQTPARVMAMLTSHTPLAVSASLYLDYGRAFVLAAQGRPDNIALWGTGIGVAASAGPHWQARFLFSVPLISAGTVPAYQPFFNFALTAQF